MSGRINLKEAEQKAFVANYQDGLWDILVGYIVSVFAIQPFLREPMGENWSTAVFFPIGILIWLIFLWVRKYVVVPRIGLVTFSRARRKRVSWTFFSVFTVNFVARFLGFDLLELLENPGWEETLRFGVLPLALFFIPAYFLKFRRLYVYGILVAGSPVISELMFRQWGTAHHGFPIVFGITAAIIIAIGVVLFTRLMRGNPPMTAEAMAQGV
jgi:hypothetical protein